MTTKQQVEQLAAKLGVTIDVRPGAGGFCWIVATAPDGFRFDAAHEVTSEFVPGVKGDKEKAWQDTLADLQHVQPCTDPNCEWCRPEPTRIILRGFEPEPFVPGPEWTCPSCGARETTKFDGRTFRCPCGMGWTEETDESEFMPTLRFGSIRTVADRGGWADLHGIVDADAPMVASSDDPFDKAISANLGWGLHDSVDTSFGDGSTRGWSPVILGDLVPDWQLLVEEDGASSKALVDKCAEFGTDFAMTIAQFAHAIHGNPGFAQQQHTQLWAPDGSIERIGKQNGSDTGAACVARVEDVPREYTQHSSYAAWFTHHAIPAQTVWVKHLPAVFGRGSDDFEARYQTVVDDANYQAHFGGVGYGDDPSGRALIGKPDEVTLGFGGGYGPSWSKLLHGLVAATVRGATFELTAAGHALLDGQVCAHCGAELKPGWDGGKNVYTYTVEVLTEARPDASYVPARYTSYHQVIAGGPFVCCAACMDEATKPQPDDPKPGETIWVDGRQTKVRGVHGEGLCYDLEETTRCGHYGATLPRSEWPERLRYATADMCDECVGQVGRLCGHECRPVEQPVDDAARIIRTAIEGALDLGLASFTDPQNGSNPDPRPSGHVCKQCGADMVWPEDAFTNSPAICPSCGWTWGHPVQSNTRPEEVQVKQQLPIHTHDEHGYLVPKQYRAFAKGVEVWLVTVGAEPTRTGTISRSVYRSERQGRGVWYYGFAAKARPDQSRVCRASDLANGIADGDYELRMPVDDPPKTRPGYLGIIDAEKAKRSNGKASVTAKQPLASESWQERNFEVDQTAALDLSDAPVQHLDLKKANEHLVKLQTEPPLAIAQRQLNEALAKAHDLAGQVNDLTAKLNVERSKADERITGLKAEARVMQDNFDNALKREERAKQELADLYAEKRVAKEQLLRTQSALETERRSVEAWKKVADASRDTYHELTAQLAAEVDHKYDGYPDGVVALVDALHEWMTEGGDNPAPLHAGALLFDDDHSLQEHVASCYELLHRQNGSVLAVPPLAELQRDLAKLDWELVAAWRIHEHARGYRLTYVILAKRRQPVFPEAPYVVSHWSGGDTLPSGFGGSRYDLTAERGAEVFSEEARENWV